MRWTACRCRFRPYWELLSGFSEAESGWFHSLCIERRFLRDAEVFRQGDPPDGICVVKKGLLKIVSISEKGTEQILHILRPGDVFGELILLGKPRPFTAVSLTDATVSILPLAVVQDLLATSPIFSRNYLRLLSMRLYELEQTFPALVQAWPHHRLAKELLHLAEDLGDETPKGTRLTLHLTHELLSNLIGASAGDGDAAHPQVRGDRSFAQGGTRPVPQPGAACGLPRARRGIAGTIANLCVGCPKGKRRVKHISIRY